MMYKWSPLSSKDIDFLFKCWDFLALLHQYSCPARLCVSLDVVKFILPVAGCHMARINTNTNSTQQDKKPLKIDILDYICSLA